MYRITYAYWKPIKEHPEWGKYGESVKDYVYGDTFEEVCDNFNMTRYHHDVVKYSTIDFIKIEEIEK